MRSSIPIVFRPKFGKKPPVINTTKGRHYTHGDISIGADFWFEVPGQSSVELIGGGRGQWLWGTMASAEHEPIMGVWGQSPSGVQGSGGRSPPEAESILVIGCPMEPAN